MKQTLLFLGIVGAFVFGLNSRADTLIVVTNGTGGYSTNYLSFNDARRRMARMIQSNLMRLTTC